MVDIADADALHTSRGLANDRQTAPNGLRSSQTTLVQPTPASPAVELAEEIASHLWSQLPFARVAEETGHRGIEHIVRVASASHAKIADWYRDVTILADVICETVVELHGDKMSDEYHRSLFDEVKKEILLGYCPPMPPRSIVDYRFADRSPQAATIEATEHLKSHCVQIANHFVSLLEHLSERNLVGSVEFGDATCRFSFYARHAEINQTSPKKRHIERTLDPEFANTGHKAYFVKTYDKSSSIVKHRRSMHVHHVRNPERSTPENCKYVIPSRYKTMIDAIPDCIRPLVQILEGELFREERIEWDAYEEQRPDVILVSSRWTRCPGLLLGDYVLAGWGDQPIAAQERHDNDAADAVVRAGATTASTGYAKYASVVGIVSIVSMLVGALGFSVLIPLAIALGVVSMFLSSQSETLGAPNGQYPTSMLSMARVARSGCILFAWQAAIFGVLQLSLVAILVAVVLAFAAVVLLKRMPYLAKPR